MKYAKVAVSSAAFSFDKAFDYAVPDSLVTKALPGMRVTVPFGAGNKPRIGIIFELADTTESKKVKKITEVLDDSPLINEEMLSLALWLKERTFCTLFEAASVMLPSGINHKIVYSYCAASASPEPQAIASLSEKEEEFYSFVSKRGGYIKGDTVFKSLGMVPDKETPQSLIKKGLIVSNANAVRNVGDATVRMVRLISDSADGIKITKKQQEIIDVLTDVGSASVKELCYFTGLTPAVISALVKNGVAEYFENEVLRSPIELRNENPVIEPIKLTDEQEQAFDSALSLYDEGKGRVSLLYGVTGSGKTSVYMSLIDRVVEQGRGVIVMVPEISLTPQTLSLFCSRYGSKVALFHSALSAGERADEWKRVKGGDAKIVIGTRSAVFAPISDIGLIIVDEEQEHTYKSEQSPRYDTIEVAKFRSAYHKGLLLLSSATPSVERFAAAKSGKYALSVLKNRYGKAVLPKVITVDMRVEPKAPGSTSISRVLFEALSENLADGKQSILLINRRGYNTFAACNSCGHVICCPYCSISMTYHNANGRLMCHYCGHSRPFSEVCPECGEKSVRYSGFGTQKIEDELKSLLPEARVARMDTDSMGAKNSHERLLESFSNGEYDILIGTQMVAKGLDFPSVTLVGVVSVDQQLYNDDFRSLERTFSLLTQVVGRSGRGEFEGRAIVQTLTPENEIIRLAAKQDYEAFFETEIRMRKLLTYPPYCDLCVLAFVGTEELKVSAAAKYALELLMQYTAAEYKNEKIIVLGPMPARVAKLNNKYRHRLIIKCKNTAGFRKMISKILTVFGTDSRFAAVTAYADINPETTI